MRDAKIKESEVNNSKHSLDSICYCVLCVHQEIVYLLCPHEALLLQVN
jgi:hypothetical protein